MGGSVLYHKVLYCCLINDIKYKDAIKELRKRLPVSQSELAEMLNVSYATVNRWEQGLYEPIYAAKRKLRVLFKENKIGPNTWSDKCFLPLKRRFHAEIGLSYRPIRWESIN